MDKSFSNDTQKLWILQHLLIPRIQCPLLICEAPISHAAKLEQKISSFIRKWLLLHKLTSFLCFYSKASPCRLPINSLTSVLKSAKISGHLLLCDSQDPLVPNCIPQLKTHCVKSVQVQCYFWSIFSCTRTEVTPLQKVRTYGKYEREITPYFGIFHAVTGSWHVEETVATTESDVKNKLLSGHYQFGWADLGYSPGPKAPSNKSTKLYHKFITATLMFPIPSPKQCSCKFKVNRLSR